MQTSFPRATSAVPDGIREYTSSVKFRCEGIGYFPHLSQIFPEVSHGFSFGPGIRNMSLRLEPDETKYLVPCRVDGFLNSLGLPGQECSIALRGTGKRSDGFEQLVIHARGPESDRLRGKEFCAHAAFTDQRHLPITVKPADCVVSICAGADAKGRPSVGVIHADRDQTGDMFTYFAMSDWIDRFKIDAYSIGLGIIPSLAAPNHTFTVRPGDEDRFENSWADSGFSAEHPDGFHNLDISGYNLAMLSCRERGVLEGVDRLLPSNSQVEFYNIDSFAAAAKGHCFSNTYARESKGQNGRIIVTVGIL